MELTECVVAKISRYEREWRRIGMAYGAADIEAVRPDFERVYAKIGKKCPPICRATSIRACLCEFASDYIQDHDFLYNLSFSMDDVPDKLGEDVFRLLSSSFNRLTTMFNFSNLYLEALKSDFIEVRAAAKWDMMWTDSIRGSSFAARAFYCDCAIVLGCSCSDEDIYSLRRAIAKNCFCFWAMRDKILLCDRPAMKWDGQGRLHCDDGPAIRFDDGFSIYAWHGVRVPETVILAPERLTLDDIYRESNVETRRACIERFGWLRYLSLIGAKVKDTRRNEIEGTHESLMGSPDGDILVCACPSTARVYALEVPNEIASCEQAQIWLSGGLSGRITTAT